MHRLVLLPLLVVSAACAARATPPPVAPAVPAAVPDAIRWVQQSAEHRAAFLQVYRLAAAHVDRAASGRAAGTWAVVLDADETVIDNSTYQLERARVGAGFSPATWNAWVQRRAATPLPGAADFLARVRELGGRIAIVTNRLQSECDDTAAVFQTHALPYDAMLCRPDGSPSDKNPRFAAVAAGQTPAGRQPLEVVAFLGDNIQDFPGLTQAAATGPASGFADFGVRYFVLPNPMYGSWQ
ncbi:MAG: 5'-nucleotidase, lipoprotein e(P4) family [Dehalococcoidia bacterium]